MKKLQETKKKSYNLLKLSDISEEKLGTALEFTFNDWHLTCSPLSFPLHADKLLISASDYHVQRSENDKLGNQSRRLKVEITKWIDYLMGMFLKYGRV
jgi:hypothetical protein